MFLKPEFSEEIKRLTAAKRRESLQRVAAATPVDTGKARASWRIEGKEVVSDVAYMADLNDGSSAQAPSYFIERAILADPSLVPNGTIVLKK
jgi:hypothetical protein